MPSKIIPLPWPQAGLFRRLAYGNSPRSATLDCNNVWPDDAFEARERGGSRSGLGKYFTQQLGSGNPVRSLGDLSYVASGTLTTRLFAVANGLLYRENPVGTLAAVTGAASATWYWTVEFIGALANTNVAQMTPIGSPAITVTTTQGGGGGHNETQKIAIDLTYRPTADVAEFPGTKWRVGYVWLAADATETAVQEALETAYGSGNVDVTKVFGSSFTLNSTEPVPLVDRSQILYIADHDATLLFKHTDGVLATTSTFTSTQAASWSGVTAMDYSLVITDGGTGDSEIQTLTMTGTPTGGTFKLKLNTLSGEFYETEPIAYNCSAATMQAAVRATFVDENGVVIATFSFSGSDFPAGVISCSFSGNYANDDVPLLEVDYAGLTGGTAPKITVAEYVKGGPPQPGTFLITGVSGTTLTLSPANTTSSNAAGGSGAGGVNYYVTRNPKRYDPVENIVSPWVADVDKGSVPVGCPLCCLWRDRLVLAGGAVGPHLWYMSRQGDPHDWDYSVVNDAGAAVAGQASLAGQLGEPIKCLIPHSDDCLIIGCETSLWIMRGDPAAGGRIDRLSAQIGIVGPRAWCYTPEGWLYFLSQDGVYMMAPGCGSVPQSVSRELLPDELVNVAATVTVAMEYDVFNRMIYLTLTPATAGSPTHYALDAKQTANRDTGVGPSFWPMAMYSDFDPFCIYARRNLISSESVTFLGCRDGYIRRFNSSLARDDARNFSSYIWLGPLKLDDYHDSLLKELVCTLGHGSGKVKWEVKTGKSAEECYNAESIVEGVFDRDGFNPTARPRLRGGAVMVKLSNLDGNTRWALEALAAVIDLLGKRRL